MNNVLHEQTKPMTRQTIFILTLLLLFLKTYACECIGQATVKESVKGSDIVTVGIVISKTVETLTDNQMIKLLHPDTSQYKTFPYSTTIAKYKVVVNHLFKGKNSSDTITVYTGLGGGDCGYEFNVGSKYIIYGQKNTYFGQVYNDFNFPSEKNIYWTDICTRTTIFNEKEFNEIETETKEK